MSVGRCRTVLDGRQMIRNQMGWHRAVLALKKPIASWLFPVIILTGPGLERIIHLQPFRAAGNYATLH